MGTFGIADNSSLSPSRYVAPSTESIACTDLIIGYDKSRPVFPEINLRVRPTEFIILTGRNGTGKSTLLRTIAGLQPPVSGIVKVNDRLLSGYSQNEKAKLIGFVSTEKIDVADMTVFELVAMGKYARTGWLGKLADKDKHDVIEAIGTVGMAHSANRKTSELSDGELQRASIARTLAQDTSIIILDEPTAFLDLPNSAEIILLLRNLAKNKNKTILLSTHDLSMAMQSADRICLLSCNGMIQGAPRFFAENKLLDELFRNSQVKYNYSTFSVEFINPYSHK